MDENGAIHPKLAQTLREMPLSVQERLADALPGLLALAEALTPAAVDRHSGELPLLEGMAEDGLLHPDAPHLGTPSAATRPPLSAQVQDRTNTQGRDLPGYHSRKQR